jgi:anthranilate/para-aminobenzoate synthase component I
MVATPDFAGFSDAYETGAAQLVRTVLVGDLETPVSAFLKLRAAHPQHAFLLESVEGGETRGRHSLIGIAPDLVLRAVGNKAEINTQWTTDREAFVPSPLPSLDALRALGHPLADAVQACAHLPSVPGRMNSLGGVKQPLVVVDYAHTPDALEKALQALHDVAQQRQGKLWCVVGCGGERDVGKRPLMARVAEAQAQCVVLTSDNPRSEDPMAILAQMCSGLQQPDRAQVQADRRQAITDALAQAHARDVVLIAGKGHEMYQDIQGQRLPFSDAQLAQACLDAGAWV